MMMMMMMMCHGSSMFLTSHLSRHFARRGASRGVCASLPQCPISPCRAAAPEAVGPPGAAMLLLDRLREFLEVCRAPARMTRSRPLTEEGSRPESRLFDEAKHTEGKRSIETRQEGTTEPSLVINTL